MNRGAEAAERGERARLVLACHPMCAESVKRSGRAIVNDLLVHSDRGHFSESIAPACTFRLRCPWRQRVRSKNAVRLAGSLRPRVVMNGSFFANGLTVLRLVVHVRFYQREVFSI